MVKHIVLFKLQSFDTQAHKEARMNEIKKQLENLIHMIDELKEIHVGLNINPAEKWDIALEAITDTQQDMDTYARNTIHQDIVKNTIKPVLEERACVDFII